jgi:hypothetical protein
VDRRVDFPTDIKDHDHRGTRVHSSGLSRGEPVTATHLTVSGDATISQIETELRTAIELARHAEFRTNPMMRAR